MSVIFTLLFAGFVLTFAPLASSEIHAVLFSGSSSFSDYHHQANIAHAYHVLKNHGVKPENIIVMMLDDVANDKMNPHPGTLSSKPGGPNLYAELKVDYKGKDVTPQNILAVLTGDASALNATSGNGKVLKSTKEDQVFIYHTGHGGKGYLCIVESDEKYGLKAADLNQAFKTMHDRGMYKEMLIYLEACYSETIFKNMLPADLNILAFASAKSDQQSMRVHCDTNAKMDGVCMSDEFSAAWMEDAENKDLNKQSLGEQFKMIQSKMKKSTPLIFGDEKMLSEPVGNFLGPKLVSRADRVE